MMEEKKEVQEPRKTVDLSGIKDVNTLKVMAYDLSEQIQICTKELQMIRARINQINAGI